MKMRIRQPKFLLSSFAIGALAAFSSAGLLDWLYFDRAVQWRIADTQRDYRMMLVHMRERMDERLFDEIQAARERADAAAHGEVVALTAQVKSAWETAEARKMLLEKHHGTARELANVKQALASTKRELEQQRYINNQFADDLKRQPDSALASFVVRRASLSKAVTNNPTPEQRAMRAEFARQIKAEGDAKKKPKGPVYLNTPQGRVIHVPAERNG